MENEKQDTQASAALLTLDAIYVEKVFDIKPLRQPRWLKDGRLFSYLDTLPDSEVVTVWLYDVEQDTHTSLIPAALLKNETETIVIQGCHWSPDETRLLLARVPQRHGEGDKALYVYDLAAQTLTCVARSEQEFRNVKWSPDGRSLGFVRADDLWRLDLETGAETRLTDTAAEAVYNGRLGWSYQEELDLADGWAWSPDGRFIAYLQMDETTVPTVSLTKYDDLHLASEIQRYPKAGDPNPIARLGIITGEGTGNSGGEEEKGRTEDKETIHNPQSTILNTRTPNTRTPNTQHPTPNTQHLTPEPPIPNPLWLDFAGDADTYIVRMQWTPDNHLLVQRVPRLQNRLELLRVDPFTGNKTLLLTEEDAAWVHSPGDVSFVGETGEWLWLSERSGYAHLYLYDREGRLLRQLTNGEWEVESILGIDAEKRMVYYSAARPTPYQRQIYGVSLDGGESVLLTPEPGVHYGLFAPNGTYFLHTHSTRNTPPTTFLRRTNGEFVRTFLANPLPKAQVYRQAVWEFTSFEINTEIKKDETTQKALQTAGATAETITLNVAMLKPADFDPARRYPVLMYTYGGPGSQAVVDAFSARIGLEQYLSQQGIILVCVDGRGSGMRGRDFKKCTYLNLGLYEVEDQIAGARWLQTLPFVDPARVGIWGWSYGGYMTCLCMLRGADVFKAGVAVAPVTDWRLYDSIYTERYMQRPEDNPTGYELSAPLKYAEKLQGKFLLIHGLADDNVHFQNAAQLAERLQKFNKPFQMMVYPGKRHGLEGVGHHWAQLFTDFILANL